MSIGELQRANSLAQTFSARCRHGREAAHVPQARTEVVEKPQQQQFPSTSFIIQLFTCYWEAEEWVQGQFTFDELWVGFGAL